MNEWLDFYRSDNRIRTYTGVILFFIICLAAYIFLTHGSYVKLLIETSSTTDFKIYWKSGDASFSEAKSKSIKIHPSKHAYTFSFVNLEAATTLRFDPTNGHHLKIKLRDISLLQDGYYPIRILRPNTFRQLTPNDQVSQLKINASGLSYISNGSDAHFIYNLELKKEPFSFWTHIWRFGVLSLLLFFFISIIPKLAHSYQFVPYVMLIILTLITTMAIISRPHAHPDEHVHIKGATYYETHSLPPTVCDPETHYTYSIYGTSRLNKNELYYLIAGKYLKLTDLVPLENYVKLRTLSLLFFAILAYLTIVNQTFRLLCIPLLFTPQVWYLFSYANSEAFSLFVTLIVAYQIVAPDSLFRKVTTGRLKWGKLASLIALSGLTCLLFFIKNTFYFFTLFVFIIGAVTLYTSHMSRTDLLSKVKPIALIVAGGVALLGSWHLYQQSINDFQRAEKQLECREQLADYPFRPSTPIAKSARSMLLREKGFSFQSVLGLGWASATYNSAAGYYGYLEHPGSNFYYNTHRLLLLTFVFYLVIVVARKGTTFERLSTLIGIAFFLLLVTVTFWRSWNIDYQPQGRFYFSMMPIAAVIFFLTQHRLDKRIVSAITLGLALLGMLSFISIGLLEIRKSG